MGENDVNQLSLGDHWEAKSTLSEGKDTNILKAKEPRATTKRQATIEPADDERTENVWVRRILTNYRRGVIGRRE